MKRIERPPSIFYVERDVAGSLLYLYLTCVGVLILYGFNSTSPGRPGDGWGSLNFLWIGCALTVLPLLKSLERLFYARALVLEQDSENLVMVDRALFRRSRRTSIALDGLQLWFVDDSQRPLAPAEIRRVTYFILLHHPGSATLTLTPARSAESLRELAVELSRDLGIPLWQAANPLRNS